MSKNTSGSNAIQEKSTKVVTGKVRFSYAHVFEPSSMSEGQDKKFSVNIIIPKKDKATIAAIREAQNTAIEIGKTSKFGNKTNGLKLPLRDGDEDRPEDENYADSYFINASSKQKPQVIEIVNGKGKPITSEEDFYSGCYGKVSLNFYPFNTNGNKGIGAGLNNILKLEDGERLSGRSDAAADFGIEIEDDEDDFLS